VPSRHGFFFFGELVIGRFQKRSMFPFSLPQKASIYCCGSVSVLFSAGSLGIDFFPRYQLTFFLFPHQSVEVLSGGLAVLGYPKVASMRFSFPLFSSSGMSYCRSFPPFRALYCIGCPGFSCSIERGAPSVYP